MALTAICEAPSLRHRQASFAMNVSDLFVGAQVAAAAAQAPQRVAGGDAALLRLLHHPPHHLEG